MERKPRTKQTEPCPPAEPQTSHAPGCPLELKARLKELSCRLKNFTPDPQNPHDEFMVKAVKQALKAAKKGNYGVGAIIVRLSDGKVLQKGRNRFLHPHFASELHAEGDALSRREKHKEGDHTLHQGCALFTSVEPCLMCFGRLIVSGMPEVYYAAADDRGGMVQRRDHIPDAFKEILGERPFEQSSCSKELKELAMDIFVTTLIANDAKLKNEG